MIPGYLKIALRYLIKNPGYSMINISGLMIGITCCIVISLYIFHELSYDRYHENAENIYRLAADANFGGKSLNIPKSSPPMADFLKENYPEIRNAVRFYRMPRVAVSHNEILFYEGRIFFADPSVFEIFTFPMLRGDSASALKTANSVVISESVAKKYFGQNDPMGKTLRFNNQDEFTVTGVIKNVPHNSHFNFDMLCSFQTHAQMNPKNMEKWLYLNYYTYILLSDGARLRDVTLKLSEDIDKYLGPVLDSFGASLTLYLQPLTRIYLHSDLEQEISPTSNMTYIYVFSIIALFVLAIACINFINLATARTAGRLKEVGIRKVLGANRIKLIIQFLAESLVYSTLSSMLALILAELCMPIFRSLTGLPLSLDYAHILIFLPVIIICLTLAAGGYPALYLSGFVPITMFKKQWVTHFNFRRSLVVFQFTISVAMIICTLVIYQQINYMKNKKLGFNKEQILVIPLRDNRLHEMRSIIQDDLRNFEGILQVAASSHVPGNVAYSNPYWPEGFEKTNLQWMNELYMDDNYISTLGLEILQGRSFKKDMKTDETGAVIINETAMKKFGWKDPVGKSIHEIKNESEFVSWTVIGVLKDFHFQSLHSPIEPLIVFNNPNRLNLLALEIRKDNLAGTMNWLKEKWKKYDQVRPFEYWFLDQSFDRQYQADLKLSRIFLYFTGIALMVACLGLFGLVSFTSERRSKEIGIRKVLGASVSSLISMLTFEFSKWVLISNIVAWPLAYYACNLWLQSFAYRINLSWDPFLISAALTLGITLFTVAFHSIKASLGNPVEVLRYE